MLSFFHLNLRIIVLEKGSCPEGGGVGLGVVVGGAVVVVEVVVGGWVVVELGVGRLVVVEVVVGGRVVVVVTVFFYNHLALPRFLHSLIFSNCESSC